MDRSDQKRSTYKRQTFGKNTFKEFDKKQQEEFITETDRVKTLSSYNQIKEAKKNLDLSNKNSKIENPQNPYKIFIEKNQNNNNNNNINNGINRINKNKTDQGIQLVKKNHCFFTFET